MNWKNFQAEAFRLTEEEIDGMTPYILAHYKKASEDILKELENVHSKILLNANPDDYYGLMLKQNRLESLLFTVNRQYINYATKAGEEINSIATASMSNTFYRLQYANAWLIPEISFAILPDDLIQLSVFGSVEAWKRYETSVKLKIFGDPKKYFPRAGTISELLAKSRARELESINRTITQGLIKGQSYHKTARELKDIISTFVKKNGVEKAKGAIANSLRIVRTETTRIMNDGAYANTMYARSQGVNIKRVWSATLDRRTRPAHAALDDKEENENGMWISPAGETSAPGRFNSVGQNVNCRCTTFEAIDGYRPSIRSGKNPVTGEYENFSYKNFEDWAKANNLEKNQYGQYYSTI